MKLIPKTNVCYYCLFDQFSVLILLNFVDNTTSSSWNTPPDEENPNILDINSGKYSDILISDILYNKYIEWLVFTVNNLLIYHASQILSWFKLVIDPVELWSSHITLHITLLVKITSYYMPNTRHITLHTRYYIVRGEYFCTIWLMNHSTQKPKLKVRTPPTENVCWPPTLYQTHIEQNSNSLIEA